MSGSPVGWGEVQFRELNRFIPKTIDPASFPEERFELYSVPSFPTGMPESVLGQEIGSTKQVVEPGDVLVCKINPRINRVWQVRPKRGLRQIASSEWIVMRAPGLDPRFLRHHFSSPAFRGRIVQDVTGVGGSLTRAQPKRVATFALLVAPLIEQKRIADKLDAVLARVDACREHLDHVPAIVKRFRQSVLAAATSGKLTEDWRKNNPSEHKMVSAIDKDPSLPDVPEGWRWVNLPQIGEMSRGKSRHRPRNEPSLYGGPYPFIQTGDIAQSEGRIIAHRQTYSEKGLAQSRLWPTGTVCITIAANIAESALLTYPASFPDSVVGIIPNPDVCRSEYVEFFIRVAKADPATFAPATAQKNINIAILNEVSVPLPAAPEQDEIVRRVEVLFAYADRLEASYAAARAQVESLTPALLAKAFRGELVPQDPSDEHATVLLERIRATRAATLHNPTKRKIAVSMPARGMEAKC